MEVYCVFELLYVVKCDTFVLPVRAHFCFLNHVIIVKQIRREDSYLHLYL